MDDDARYELFHGDERTAARYLPCDCRLRCVIRVEGYGIDGLIVRILEDGHAFNSHGFDRDIRA